MSHNRREFLKNTLFAGLGVFGGRFASSKGIADNAPFLLKKKQKFNMHGYAAPALEKVRVGVTGLGNRGSGTVQRLASLEGVEIRGLNDVEPDRVDKALQSLDSNIHNPETFSDGEDDWKKMCEREDIDLIAIVTPWDLHTDQAVYAMEHGKHVYTELPAAMTIDDCWRLVEVSERTRKHCVQMSDSCHNGTKATVLNMVRNGVFGELIHGEGAYIHDLMNQYNFTKDMYHDMWRLEENIGRDGSLYPQHGLVPVQQMMDLNYGDQMDYLVSVSSNDFMMAKRAKELAAEDDFWEPYVGKDYRGNINTTVIRTQKGRTIVVQHDVTSPRPRVRFHNISGTEGIFQAGPGKIGFSYEEGWIPDEEYNELIEKYTPEINKRFDEMVANASKEEREKHPYERVNATDWRLIDSIRNGIPVEMDVYDAALSSAVIPLSEWSVASGSAPIKVPDFTAGAWKTNERGMRVNLEYGGGTTSIR